MFLRTLKLTLAYDGTAYVGWQRQPTGASIQQVVEEALAPFMPGAPPPTVTGAGRTDAGVHATGQVASVRVGFDHPVDAVQRAINIRLPLDIRVRRVEVAVPSFHARIDARGKLYRYRLATAPVVLPMDRWFVWHVPEPLDREAMREAARALVGTHDFAAFQATGSSITDTRRTIRRIDLVQAGDELHVAIEGDGFLRHMVRIITGSLVDVGRGRHDPAWVAEALAGRDRQAAGRTAPAAGLVLERVDYGQAPDGR
ncbi:MAG: tRNA pseudouridine(38-40) synthase TruA [Acidobacteria bacterium SCN 69-37]|nr:MAG: tRNA pseudouridine(38-40) synthase TruA [Acidobacteria bacterium SCN 69-37]